MHCFKKCEKLRKNQEFQAVYKEGRSLANRMLVLYVLPVEGMERKVGISVSKRLGCAVVRNRCKRLLREAFRLHRQHLKAGVQLVFICRKPMVGSHYEAVAESFRHICRKSKVWQAGGEES